MATEETSIAILILAAGASSRMGRPKQLLAWNDTTLLGNAIQNAIASQAKQVVVVVGAKGNVVGAEAVKKGVVSVHNPHWEQGMGSSIVCGLKYLQTQKVQYDGVLILLADQPLIDTPYVNEMIRSFHDQAVGIVATRYEKKAGVPALFGSSYFEKLTLLNQEQGAKSLLKKHREDIFLLDAGIGISDIDTPEDYEGLRRRKL